MEVSEILLPDVSDQPSHAENGFGGNVLKSSQLRWTKGLSVLREDFCLAFALYVGPKT